MTVVMMTVMISSQARLHPPARTPSPSHAMTTIPPRRLGPLFLAPLHHHGHDWNEALPPAKDEKVSFSGRSSRPSLVAKRDRLEQ